MADISKLSRLFNGVQRNVDISSNTLVTQSIKVGGSVSNTELTKTILDNLVTLQGGGDAGALHTHDGRYFTETELGSATASSGSDLIGDDNTYSNFTPSAATVKGALAGIDSALATAGSKEFLDSEFRVTGSADATKKVAIEVDGLTTATTRTITMPDANVNLTDVNNAVLVGGSRAFTADQSMGGFKLTNVATPVSSTDAANKAYVDAVKQGLDIKDSVRALSTSNVALTGTAQPTLTIDGVSLANSDRVLLVGQTTGSENGIYVVGGIGSNYTLTRATDADSSAEVTTGMFTFVSEGTANADSGWVLTTNDPITLDTTALSFTQFSGAGQITAGAGLTKTGNTIDVAAADSSITVNADSIQVKLDPAGAITLDGGSAGIQVNLEATDPSLQISSNELGVKFDAAGALSKGASGVKANVDGSTIEIATNALQLKDAGVTAAKLASGVADQTTITGGAGSALAVQYAPRGVKSAVAGEAMAADTSFLVRYAVNGETAGRVYKADKDASVSDKFYAFGVALKASAVSAGDSVNVTFEGTHILGASDTAFNAADIGKPVYLTAAGAFSVTAPSAVDEAVYRIGVVENTDRIWVGDKQLNGIN